jgi:hypothetical protein
MSINSIRDMALYFTHDLYLNYLFLRKENKPKDIAAVSNTPMIPARATEILSFSSPAKA